MPDTEAGAPALLHRAQSGDSRAFDELAEAYRAELRAHCYRILGSVHDAEDALQDAMLRAWKGLPGFSGHGTVRAWLYAIATNTALDISKHRSRRELPVEFGPPAGPGAEFEPNATEVPWLEPYPDQWLAPEAFGQAAAAPEARYEQRESIELAFIVALQQLPPLQRAALLLKEVVGFSTAEISTQLGTSPQSVNSALQRARASVRDRQPKPSQQATLARLGEQRIAAIARQYADAIESGDVDTLISMLTQDASWSMPPTPTWFHGREAVRDFLVRFPLRETWRHRTTSANGQLAVGGYLLDPDRQVFVPWVIDVLTFEGENISAVTAFFTAEGLGPADDGGGPGGGGRSGWVPGAEYFPRFGLPASVS
jgi:RNA polymerase sigma-70 factor, ECF subfamily